MPLRMLITNTKVVRDTKALVANVSARKSKHPDLSVTANEERLRELMEMNQGLLLSVGVTHASIETVLQTAMKHKLASKLTGAGGGGCVLTFTYLYPRSSSL
ncbi:mevalonate kinase [Gossypium australe]|uniref:Mevalonate kinase n=1 Tax=Gossypium australe TaxID=47621 RepID=A0A5B6VTY2_9ROSI|nr:mevalonate kinase [Gossypium australe]